MGKGGRGNNGICGMHNKTVDVNAPNKFPDGLCSCFNDIGSCVDGALCDCFLAGLIFDEIMNATKPQDPPPVNNCCSGGFWYALLFNFDFCVGSGLLACHLRSNVQYRYSLGGETGCASCAKAWFCPALSNCQLYRMLKHVNCPPGKVLCASDQFSCSHLTKPKIMSNGKAIWGAYTGEGDTDNEDQSLNVILHNDSGSHLRGGGNNQHYQHNVTTTNYQNFNNNYNNATVNNYPIPPPPPTPPSFDGSNQQTNIYSNQQQPMTGFVTMDQFSSGQ